ncbi:MAG: PAC2 family protein, partial [Candidatus Bathyarchaeia archaeon]
MSELKIVEKKPVAADSLMLFGFPDVGLVGVIAASHLIDELGLEEVAYVDSRLLPPVIVVHEGQPHSSLRIFGKDKILLAVSEIPLSAEVIYPAMDALIEWGKSKKIKMMVALSGIPIQDRADATELKVFATVSNLETLKTVQKQGIEALMEGYIVGPQAIMLMR